MTMKNPSQPEISPKPSGINVSLLAERPQISMLKEAPEVIINPARPLPYASRPFASIRGLISGLSRGHCRVGSIRLHPWSSVVRHPRLLAVRVLCG
jgi:hypothetical protein